MSRKRRFGRPPQRGEKGERGDPGAQGEKGEKGDPGRDAPGGESGAVYGADSLMMRKRRRRGRTSARRIEETVNQQKDDKVNQSDALTLEEIMASTDLSKKSPAPKRLNP